MLDELNDNNILFVMSYLSMAREAEMDVSRVLQDAAGYGKLDIIKLIYKSNSNYIILTPGDALIQCCDAYDSIVEMVRFMTGVGVDVNSVDRYNRTALDAICSRSDGYNTILPVNQECEFAEMIHNVVCVLLQLGAHVNVYDNNHNTPLHSAVRYGYFSATVELLNYQADVNVRNNVGATAIGIACTEASYDCLKENKWLADDSVEMLQLLVNHGAEVNVKDTEHIPLIETCRWKRPAYVQFLLVHGAEVNGVTPKGRVSSLMLACGQGCLLEYGAEVNIVDGEGRTALMYACQGYDRPYLSCIKALLRYGADIDHKDSQGRTALMSVITRIHQAGDTVPTVEAQVALVSALLEHGADMTVADNEGRTVRDVVGVSDAILEVLEKAQHRSEHVLK